MVLYLFKQNEEREEEFFDDEEDHECDEHGDSDIDICDCCRDHASFCSECGLSNCCGAPPIETDYEMDDR